MKKLKFTKSKWRALSTILSNMTEVFLASMVLPIFNVGLDSESFKIVLLGLIVMISAAYLSLICAENGEL